MVRTSNRGNEGRGSRGDCGGTRRRDGSGGGIGNRRTGNRRTSRQPRKRSINY